MCVCLCVCVCVCVCSLINDTNIPHSSNHEQLGAEDTEATALDSSVSRQFRRQVPFERRVPICAYSASSMLQRIKYVRSIPARSDSVIFNMNHECIKPSLKVRDAVDFPPMSASVRQNHVLQASTVLGTHTSWFFTGANDGILNLPEDTQCESCIPTFRSVLRKGMQMRARPRSTLPSQPDKPFRTLPVPAINSRSTDILV